MAAASRQGEPAETVTMPADDQAAAAFDSAPAKRLPCMKAPNRIATGRYADWPDGEETKFDTRIEKTVGSFHRCARRHRSACGTHRSPQPHRAQSGGSITTPGRRTTAGRW